MKSLFSSIIALVYVAIIGGLLYMSAGPALSEAPVAASVAGTTGTTTQPS